MTYDSFHYTRGETVSFLLDRKWVEATVANRTLTEVTVEVKANGRDVRYTLRGKDVRKRIRRVRVVRSA